jgi:hypothetical protein
MKNKFHKSKKFFFQIYEILYCFLTTPLDKNHNLQKNMEGFLK